MPGALPAGRCTASTSPSTPTSFIPGRRTHQAAACRLTISIRSAAIACTSRVPPAWKGRDIYLHFDGVDSAFYAWVNGTKLGYSEDSRTPAEFDMTPHLKPGSNLLAVEVYRFGDGAFLEDQDMWRMSGIFRDVYLWSTPQQHVRDFEVNTDLDAAVHAMPRCASRGDSRTPPRSRRRSR